MSVHIRNPITSGLRCCANRFMLLHKSNHLKNVNISCIFAYEPCRITPKREGLRDLKTPLSPYNHKLKEWSNLLSKAPTIHWLKNHYSLHWYNCTYYLFTLYRPSVFFNEHNGLQSAVLFYYDLVTTKTKLFNKYFLSVFNNILCFTFWPQQHTV